MVIVIGENAQDNWDKIQESSPTDIWVHMKSFPSSHVIIRDEDPNDERIMEAAIICKANSKYRFKNAKVSYTPISNVVLGDVVGTVHFISNRQVKTVIPP